MTNYPKSDKDATQARHKALTGMRITDIRACMNKAGVRIPASRQRIMMWAHQQRLHDPHFSKGQREKSKAWLERRGFDTGL